jgi:hypothetical protein
MAAHNTTPILYIVAAASCHITTLISIINATIDTFHLPFECPTSAAINVSTAAETAGLRQLIAPQLRSPWLSLLLHVHSQSVGDGNTLV